MAGKLFSAVDIDRYGRSLLLSDNVRQVYHYSTISETWDKVGSAGQSWYDEIYTPNDSFDTSAISSDKWRIVDTPEFSNSTLSQSGGSLAVGVEADEGIVGITSEGVWKLTGDFDIRLYLDWDSYYNEYRSITHTFFKIGVDGANAVRLTFSFDGVSGYQFNSEKAVARDLSFFDWLDNGVFELDEFSTAADYLYLKITRENGVISTYISTGDEDLQIGNAISDSIFSEDVFVELGVEAKEFNTYRQNFKKFFIFFGSISEPRKFFSTSRGERQEFPDEALLIVEDTSLSIVDEQEEALWMRVNFGTESPLPSNDIRVAACNGTIYATTSDGLIAFDFTRDQIFRYSGNSIDVADEPISMRNSEVVFRTFIDNIGSIPNNEFTNLSCRSVAGEDYLALATGQNITVLRALASGVAYSTDGPLPVEEVLISEKGTLYWSGYNSDNNDGELSVFTNVAALTTPGTNQFNRSTFYNTETGLNFFGRQITAFDVATAAGTDLLGVGTTEGLTFIGFSPGAPRTEAITFGTVAPSKNPISDPSFEDELHTSWVPFFRGSFIPGFRVGHDPWSTDEQGERSLRLRYVNISGAEFIKGTVLGVYQDVDLTSVNALYFDLLFGGPQSLLNTWDFEVLVNNKIVRSISDTTSATTIINDSADVSSFSGSCRLTFQIRILNTGSFPNIGLRSIQIDNIRTKIGDPDYRLLPINAANIQELLLQYDSGGHKIYFSSSQGYGAVDLDSYTLDFFLPNDNLLPGSENNTADFSRVDDEV